MRRREPPDYLLLTLFTVVALVPVGLVDPTGTGEFRPTVCLWKAVQGSPGWQERLGRALAALPLLCVPAAAFGWWAQAAAVRRGLRLTGRPDAQAADYGEQAVARPPRRHRSVRRLVMVWLAVLTAVPLVGLGLFYLLVYLNS
jgi:hypothetical protein